MRHRRTSAAWNGLIMLVALACVEPVANAQLVRTYADPRVPEGGDAILRWGVRGNDFDSVPSGSVVDQFWIDGVHVRVRLINPADGALVCDGAQAATSPNYVGDVVYANALRSARTGVGQGWIQLDLRPPASVVGAWVFDDDACCASSARMRFFDPTGAEIGATPSVDGAPGNGVGVDGFLGGVTTDAKIARVVIESLDSSGVSSTQYAIDQLQLRRWRPFTLNAATQTLSCAEAQVHLASTPYAAEYIWWQAYLPGLGFTEFEDGPTSVATFIGARYEYLTCTAMTTEQLRIRARIQVGDGLMLVSDEHVIDVTPAQPPEIQTHPQSAIACPGVEAELSAQVAGTAPVAMQWGLLDGEGSFYALSDGEAVDPDSGKHLLVSGALESTLRVAFTDEWTQGERVSVAMWAGNLCAGVFSDAATLLIDPSACSACPACIADFDADGGVTGGDVVAFIATWEVGEACADADLDGGVTGSDLAAFFGAFEAGGC